MNKYEKRHHGSSGEYAHDNTPFQALCAVVGAVSVTIGYVLARRLLHREQHHPQGLRRSPETKQGSFPRVVDNRRRFR